MLALFFAALSWVWEPNVARAEDGNHAGTGEDEVLVRGKSGSFVSRTKLEDAPREVTDAASLVEWLPGVHVRRLGSDDGFATISIRGSSSNQVMVYLAGVPLTGGADPTLDLASLPLWPGASARAYRSFAPAAIGPGSLGGTLVLDPPRVGTEAKTEVWVGGGSFGAARMRAADVRPELGVVTALSASRSDDDFSYYDPLQQSSHARENGGHAAVNGLVSVVRPVAWSNDAMGTFRVTTMLQARRQQLPGTTAAPTPYDELDSTRIVHALELSGPLGRGAWLSRAWFRRDDLHTTTNLTRTVATPNLSRSSDALSAVGGSFGWRGRPATTLSLELRGDVSLESFAPGARTDAGATPIPDGAHRTSLGPAVDAEWRAAPAWTFTGSARVDVVRDATHEARNDTLPTGHVGVDYDLGPLSLIAHGGALARPPSFVERYGNRGTFVGNPDLRCESAWVLDAGTRFSKSWGDLRVRGEVAGFVNWADDLITFVAQGIFGQLVASNIGRARIAGTEIDLQARFRNAELRATYTYLATENQARCFFANPGADAVCARPPLSGRPAHDLFADLSYALGPLRLRYGLDFVSGITTDLSGRIEVPARTLHSAGARIEVPHVRGLRLGLDVRNLFDVRSVTYPGATGPASQPIGDSYDFPLPGRSILVTARWLHEGEGDR